MPKLIIVSEYVYRDENTTGYLWNAAIEELEKEGIHLKVLTLKNIENSKVKKSKIIRTLIKALKALYLCLLIIKNYKKGDIIFSGTNPEILIIFIAFLKYFLGFRWLLLVHDVFPENLIPARILKSQSFFYKTLKIIFDWAYKQADLHFVIGRDMKKIIDKKIDRADKSYYIHSWINFRDIKLVEKNNSEIIQALGWQEKIVFLYYGNIGRVQEFKLILDAINLVNSNKAAFLFIGNGASASEIKEFKKNNSVVSFHYIESLSDGKRDVGLASCDIALVTLRKGMFGLGVPSKTYYSLAADRPILALTDDESEVHLMVREDKIGWHCSTYNSKDFAGKIDEICEEDLSRFKGNLRRLTNTKYSSKSALKKLTYFIKLEKISKKEI
ncbi:putative glycosyl transferase [Candidatus Methylopumilus universalis]